MLDKLPLGPNQLVFLALAGIAAMMAVGVVVMKSPVRSALCLVVSFFVLAFIYFGLGAQLLGITQILVYAGAIMVLFLFVIMLLSSQGKLLVKEKIDAKPVIGGLLGAGMLAIIGAQVLLPLNKVTVPKADAAYGAPSSIGPSLWASYAWPLELTSILLVVGIVGSILLAKRRI